MRLVAAIVLIALFGALNANKVVFQELAQINKHPFGATMLAAISTNLRAKTPLDDISDLLNKILGDLRASSEGVDRQYHEAKDAASTGIHDSQELISLYQQQISNLEDALRAYEEEGSARVASYLATQELLEHTQAELATAEANFEAQSADYSLDIQNLNEAIAACNLAVDKLNTFSQASGASLIQIASAAKTHLNNFSAKMKEMSHKLSKHGSMYAPLIHELVQLTASVDHGKVQEVVRLLNQLLGLLQDALNDLLAEKAAYEANHHNFVQTSRDNIEAYLEQMRYDAQRADEVGQQAVQARADLEISQQNLADSEASLAIFQENYDANEEWYGTERPRLNELIRIMEKLIHHFNEESAALDDWTRDQINGTD